MTVVGSDAYVYKFIDGACFYSAAGKTDRVGAIETKDGVIVGWNEVGAFL
jgi:hypothetical protein